MTRAAGRFVRVLCVFAAFGVAPACHASASLRNETQLQFALRSSPPCCVIDGRAEAQRKAHALPDALVYRKDLKINPVATVVVVADSDAQALAIAEALASAHPGKTVLAVEGGVAAWEAVVRALAADPPGGRALDFVIPSNTCEHGAPLQQLRTSPK
ncbi:hypothetical protein [Aromatoleum petrolei]|uniref:Rhodanese domain-containing protein n=1 Tax=Aromatoleum petrolei TaxID=76116 RepID=A0ABX1MM96_9RHOO|nr:hypothetical protein [Aromatoleum petrolei]NMF89075.1 hypothetical protein [Aromatoleum petrolei]QTQ38333.1 Uncharacterized protein ToN1_42310 [Aromatoleum petrolei]